jgi:hypothetical protein
VNERPLRIGSMVVEPEEAWQWIGSSSALPDQD